MTSIGDNYYENDAATAFEKYYANNLSFIGILPKAEGDFTLDELDIEGLLKSEPEYDEVNCKMPKLNFETTAELSDILSRVGLENVFSDDADFSGIADKAVHVSSCLLYTSQAGKTEKYFCKKFCRPVPQLYLPGAVLCLGNLSGKACSI